jgi:hypothetical protein
MPISRLTDHADRLARLVEELLIGPARRTGLELIYALETGALHCMDELAAKPPPDAKTAKEMRAVTVAKLRNDLAAAQSYVESAAERRAQLIYLQGMLVGVVVTAVVATLLAVLVGLLQDPIDGTEFLPTALLLGAFGAVVSVMQRLTRGNLRLRLDSGVTAVRLLGAFRPAIGGLLACAILVMALGGLVPLEIPADDGTRAFFLSGLAFLAGFSERFAQDMIGAGKATTSLAPSAGATVLASTEESSAADRAPT